MSEVIKRKWVVVECEPHDAGSRDPKYWQPFDTYPEITILREALERIAGRIGEVDLHQQGLIAASIARYALDRAGKGGGAEMKPLSEARAHLYNALDWMRVGRPEAARERIQEAVYILEDHDHVLANAPKPEVRSCETCRWGEDMRADECFQCCRLTREDYWTTAASGEGE